MIDNWEKVTSVFSLSATRTPCQVLVISSCLKQAPENFLSNYVLHFPQTNATLPELPYPKQAFHLALCADFLFWYDDLLSVSFHREAIQRLLQVATEVQIYPLVNRQGKPSPYLGDVIAHLQSLGIGSEIKPVASGQGDAVLRLWTPACTLSSDSPTGERRVSDHFSAN